MADQLSTPVAEQVGVPGYPGPFAVGRYAVKLRDRMRRFAPVCVIGEVTGARTGRGPNVYFELRDADGALPCAMWRTDFDRAGLGPDELRDGAEVVAAGHCDFYPGSATSSPRFTFCDETLCRTVALTPVPVISAVGHDVDRTLIDDVAAVCCSTPTHAAETVVGVDCGRARDGLHVSAARLQSAGRTAVL